MAWSNPVGFHTTLTDEALETIISNVRRGLTVNMIAGISLTPPTNLRRWLKRGQEDVEGGEGTTIFAQLWLKFHSERNSEILSLLERVRAGGKNWQGPWEIVKAVAREDFGTEAIEYKELVEMFAKLSQDFKQLQSGAMKQLGETKDGG